MAERLTEKVLLKKLVNGYYGDIDVYQISYIKLGMLEDIMEKYSIENLEYYLQKMREVDKELRDTIQKLRTIIDTIGYDRDTWQKACEFLAYEYAEEYFDGRDIEHCFNADKRDKFVKENINRFYQQAKKEGNDE